MGQPWAFDLRGPILESERNWLQKCRDKLEKARQMARHLLGIVAGDTYTNHLDCALVNQPSGRS